MKPNQTRIIIPGETMPVHSFDLWGTLVQQDVLGPRVLNAYREVMDGRINPLEIDQNVENYEGVLRGDPRSLEHKKDYVNTIEDPVWDAFLGGRVNINFNGVFYQDSLEVMADIAGAGEDLAVLTTGNSPWVKQAIETIDPVVANRLLRVYSGNKSLPEAYESTERDLNLGGRRMVSHTEDQLKGFEGLLRSPLLEQVNGIYVERADLATPDEVLGLGISHYVRDLRNAPYLRRE